ncbi:MAG: M23 family metallopeptidase, partial [Acidobacteriota bacterium]
EIGTPVFAIADGVVKKAGSYFPVYTDPLVQLRHYRPGYNGSCRAGGGCYVSNYMHLSDWTVAVGEHVVKGQLIGYTGASSSGFAHLHFEVRDAPSQDPYSAWSRDAIHPLRVLPYADTGTSTMKVGVDDVDSSDPMNPKVTVSVRMANTVELDLSRVEVRVYGKTADGALNWVGQPGETAVGHTPEGTGYHVYPAWFDVFDWNRQYTHKNSRKVRWSSFAQGGSNECPFWSDHPAAYDANVHLDRQDPSNPRAGYFNGIAVSPAPFNARSEAYVLSLRFEELIGVADAANLCVKARAVDVLGNATPWVEYHCH